MKLFRESLVLDYAYFKDECVAKIIYQDEKIYHRLTFEDEEYNVKNKPYPDYDKNTKTIYLRGTMKNSDNRCFSIPLSDGDDFKRRIDEINKKYDYIYKEQNTDIYEKEKTQKEINQELYDELVQIKLRLHTIEKTLQIY